MKNTIRFALMLLVVSRISALAANPIERFAKDLLTRIEEQYWWGIEEDKPAGGYLFTFEYDATGDGRNEVFVASSLEEDEGTYAWSVYSPDAHQNYTKIASEVAIPPVPGFYCKTTGSQQELQTVYRNQKFGLGVIDRYTVTAKGSVTHTTQELTPEQLRGLDADNWKETFGIGNEVEPTISKVLLAEYAKDHAVHWRAYKSDLGIAKQDQDPVDATAIAANRGFTLQNAKQLLGVP